MLGGFIASLYCQTLGTGYQFEISIPTENLYPLRKDILFKTNKKLSIDNKFKSINLNLELCSNNFFENKRSNIQQIKSDANLIVKKNSLNIRFMTQDKKINLNCLLNNLIDDLNKIGIYMTTSQIKLKKLPFYKFYLLSGLFLGLNLAVAILFIRDSNINFLNIEKSKN